MEVQLNKGVHSHPAELIRDLLRGQRVKRHLVTNIPLSYVCMYVCMYVCNT